MRNTHTKAFTLVELSIVLIIIGLIVSGVLVGQDLIRSAEITATVRQIQNYNIGVSTFRTKYGYLPGDLLSTLAPSFGFQTRAGGAGHGDGNGMLDGGLAGASRLTGENLLFWADLSASSLIANTYGGPTASNLADTGSTGLTSTTMNNFIPAAKLGKKNSIYVTGVYGQNYYGIANVQSTDAAGNPNNTQALTPLEAYQLDAKMDDGLPTSGVVQVSSGTWAGFSPTFAAAQAVTSTGTIGTAGFCIYNGVTPNVYNLKDTSSSCQLLILLGG